MVFTTTVTVRHRRRRVSAVLPGSFRQGSSVWFASSVWVAGLSGEDLRTNLSMRRCAGTAPLPGRGDSGAGPARSSTSMQTASSAGRLPLLLLLLPLPLLLLLPPLGANDWTVGRRTRRGIS